MPGARHPADLSEGLPHTDPRAELHEAGRRYRGEWEREDHVVPVTPRAEVDRLLGELVLQP